MLWTGSSTSHFFCAEPMKCFTFGGDVSRDAASRSDIRSLHSSTLKMKTAVQPRMNTNMGWFLKIGLPAKGEKIISEAHWSRHHEHHNGRNQASGSICKRPLWDRAQSF